MMSAHNLKRTSFLALATLLIAGSVQAADIVIYDASIHSMAGIWNKGSRVLVNGKKSGPLAPVLISQDAYDVSKNLDLTQKFFHDKFGMNSYDNQGSPIEAVVRVGRVGLGNWHLDFLSIRENAVWKGPMKVFMFGVGDKKTLSGYPKALDVIAHEYTHAIDNATVNLRYEGQTGALKEHIADMFGQMVQVSYGGKDDFLWGENVASEAFLANISTHRKNPVLAMRNLLFPERGMISQPTMMKSIPEQFRASCVPSTDNDKCGVHLLSGIPSQAVSMIVLELGWEKVGNILFKVLTERLNQDSDFADYARQWRAECHSQLSVDDCKVVNDSFERVGL
jgi:Zn-dependent metalloprotease